MKARNNSKIIPVHPDPNTGQPYPVVTAADVIGLTVTDLSPYCGTYGMGGPGFLGLRVEGFSQHPDAKGQMWLILCLWGADGWLTLDGRPLEANMDREKINARFDPYVSDDVVFGRVKGKSKGEVLTELVRLPAKITEFAFERDHGYITIGDRRLEILADPNDRPVFAGTSELKAFDADDDLREGWILADTPAVHI